MANRVESYCRSVCSGIAAAIWALWWRVAWLAERARRRIRPFSWSGHTGVINGEPRTIVDCDPKTSTLTAAGPLAEPPTSDDTALPLSGRYCVNALGDVFPELMRRQP